MAFSVRITDLNDYIAPSQACVVTLNGQKKAVIAETSDEIQLQPRATGSQLRLVAGPRHPNAPPPQVGDPVKVSLHDCLACSGCVTTAESILLEAQSVAELTAALARRAEGCVVVMSVSPQSRAALAALAGLPPLDAWRRLVAWLRGLGVAHVGDLGTARDLALLETAAEFVLRYRSTQAQGTLPASPAASTPGKATGDTVSATASGSPAAAQLTRLTLDLVQPTSSARPVAAASNSAHQHQCDGQGHMQAEGAAGTTAAGGAGRPGAEAVAAAAVAAGPLPMLASACPGWVCYAEKTQGAAVLPHVSTAKSPQAVMGSIVKRLVAQELGLADPSCVFHCSVMPCYDKKLEASREEFNLPGTQVPEVDCCLTTVELHQLMVQHKLPDLSHVSPLAGADGMDATLAGALQLPELAPTPAGGTGARPAYPQTNIFGGTASAPLPVGNGDTAPATGAEEGGSSWCGAPHGGQAAPQAGRRVGSAQGGEAPGTADGKRQRRTRGADLAGEPSEMHGAALQGHQQHRGTVTSLLFPDLTADSKLWGLPGGSGGYMDFVFRVAAAELFGRQVPAGRLPLRQLRNSDFQEVELLDDDGRVLLRCAIVNGFRNIQTLMRQVKGGRCPYHYVEVMACPSGCLNGGGQLKPSRPEQTAQQVLEAAEFAYHHDMSPRQPVDNPVVHELYAGWVRGGPGSEPARSLLHTHYRHRPAGLAGQDQSAAVVAPTRLATDW